MHTVRAVGAGAAAHPGVNFHCRCNRSLGSSQRRAGRHPACTHQWAAAGRPCQGNEAWAPGRKQGERIQPRCASPGRLPAATTATAHSKTGSCNPPCMCSPAPATRRAHLAPAAQAGVAVVLGHKPCLRVRGALVFSVDVIHPGHAVRVVHALIHAGLESGCRVASKVARGGGGWGGWGGGTRRWRACGSNVGGCGRCCGRGGGFPGDLVAWWQGRQGTHAGNCKCLLG